VAREPLRPEALAPLVRAAFGPQRRLTGLTRLRGGTKKGVYRLTFDGGPTAVLYVWDPAESSWPADPENSEPFAEASGAELYEASRLRLEALGVRTPRTYLVDAGRAGCPADVALVEDVRGGTLEELLRRDPAAAEPALAALAAALSAMHRHRGPRWGKVARADSAAASDRASEEVVLEMALGHLAQAAARVDRIAAAREPLEAATRELAAAVRPRAGYGLIHGELGPDHVLLDDDGQAVLIDIEGVMFFDVEWEHAFLQLRFGEHYRWLRAHSLDEARLRFFALAQALSLIVGPLRLLDGAFADRQAVLRIVETNVHRALSFVR
jgi:hypothetical protein